MNEEKGHCSVFFVDYGNTEHIVFAEIFKLPREEGFHPSLSAECCCKDVSVDFQTMLESENIYVNIVSALDSGSFIIDFTDETQGGVSNPPRAITNQQQSVPVEASRAAVGSTPEASRAAVGPPQEATRSPVGPPPGLNLQNVKYPLVEFNRSVTHDVCISNVESNGTFHCQLVRNASALEELMCLLKESVATPLIGTVTVGTPCLASDSREMVIYRGEILGNHISGIRVRLVDFGNSEDFKPEAISSIIPEFVTNFPAQARHCILKNVDAAADVAQLISLLKSYESKEAVHARVVRETSKGLLEMELFDLTQNEGVNILELVGRKRVRAPPGMYCKYYIHFRTFNQTFRNVYLYKFQKFLIG